MKGTTFGTTILWESIQVESGTIDAARETILRTARDVDDAKLLFDMLGLKDADLREMP